MIKIWLLYLLISMPGMHSVKNNSFVYSTEEECMKALTNYLNIYERKSAEYKANLKQDDWNEHHNSVLEDRELVEVYNCDAEKMEYQL